MPTAMLLKKISQLITKRYALHANKGFTMVELLVAIGILGALSGGAIIAVNPVGQYNRAYDAQRQRDLSEIKKTLDLYYHDKNCYPGLTSDFATALNSGGEWKDVSTNVVYMKKIPKDPDGTAYKYMTDPVTTSTCPQWGVVFAKLIAASSNVCPLDNLGNANCFPAGYSDVGNKWACVTMGYTNCKVLASGGGLVNFPTPTPLTSTPTPTQTPVAAAGTFDVLMNSLPTFTTGELSPYLPSTTSTPVSLQINVQDLDANGTVAGHITSVKATVSTDTKITTYDMTMSSGTDTNGLWQKTFTTDDTINSNYKITLEAQDDAAHSSSVTISVK